MTEEGPVPFSRKRATAMREAFWRLSGCPSPLLIEVGRTRDLIGFESDGWSTYHLARMAWRRGGHLISVDSDERTVPLVMTILLLAGVPTDGTLTFVTVQPDAFAVPKPNRLANFLLLDGPDCHDGREEQSARWHAECLRFMDPLLSPGGLLMIDDCFDDPDKPAGKGKLAVPWALSRGYAAVVKGYAWLLEKPL